ncbi:uncharacterized protein LOC141850821 [Brevipalpus obovatus]|uniref:uncharacterized protein LOC141850821 n=1 Tax=Brevipalpus obovatus TaxID=246614 RepID=UPI003D9E7F4D
MLSGLATYFFGSSEYDENGELLAETCIQGMDGEDWILVDQKISISSGPSCSSSPLEDKLVQSQSEPNFSHDDRKGSCTLDSSTATCSTKNLVASNSMMKTSSNSKESKQQQQQLSGSCLFDSSPSSSSSSSAHRNGVVDYIEPTASNTFYGDYQSSHKTIDTDSLNIKCNSGNSYSPSHHGNNIGLYDGGEVEDGEDGEEEILRMSSSLASSQVIHSSDATNTAIINSAIISNSNTNVAGNVFNDKKSSNLGTMEGSWFVTPPPCFINNHNPSTHKKVSVSPLEDILIEHPSISVFHSHSTIVESSCVSILDPSFSTMDQNTGLATGADGGSIDSSSNNNVEQQLKPSTSSSANNSPQTRSKRCGNNNNNNNNNNRSSAQANVPNELPLSSSSSSSSQSSSATSSPLSSPSSSNPNQMSPNHHRSNSARVQRGDSRGSRSASGAATHQRQGLLNEITNVLAPMQKAYQARSQKFLKKSFMNRQNLVMYQSNQRPKRYNRKNPPPTGYSNNRKAC